MKDETRRQLSLFLVLYQTMGLRFFQGIGILCLLLIILLNLKNFKYLNQIRKPTNVFLISFLMLGILYLKNSNLTFIANMGFIILSSILVVLNYRKSSTVFVDDLEKVLIVMCGYSLLSYVMINALPFLRVQWDLTWYAHFYTIGYIFWNQYLPEDTFMRMSGAFWEAGCCCLAFNILLLIFIHKRESKKRLAFAVLGVILTYSTAGLVCLTLNVLYYVYLHKKNVMNTSIIVAIFAVIAVPFIVGNFEDKLKGDHSTSGIVRQRDFAIGATLTLRHPLIGVVAETEALQNNKEANEIEDAVWAANGIFNWTDSGYMLGGFTNGIFGALLNYGVLIGLLLFVQIYRSPLINNEKINKKVFYAIFLAALIGEPLSATTLFLILSLSNWILPRQKSVKRISRQIEMYTA